MKSTLAQKDLAENHGWQVSRYYLQDISSEVLAVAVEKQDRWRYQDPQPGPVVNIIALGIDGTSVLFCDEGYRKAMVGTITAYDDQGRRLHTVYRGAEPEYGKYRFFARMKREITEFNERYPWAQWVGVPDGAADLWPWLEQHTDQQILDFFHASGYLGKAVAGVCPRPSQRQSCLDERAHQLKHERGATGRIIAELKQALSERKLGRQVRSDPTCALGYFENRRAKMNYAYYRWQNLPIGSGVTEAACKRVVKERMYGSGMKRKNTGTGEILRLRPSCFPTPVGTNSGRKSPNSESERLSTPATL